MRDALVLLAATGCAAGAWKPVIFSDRPRDPHGQLLALPFRDGQNGTELVLAVLAHAKSNEAGAISGLEIQVGPCVREISMRPRAVVEAPTPDAERIVLHMREPGLACRRRNIQELVPNLADSGSKPTFSDVQITTRDECHQIPRSHVVMRYRFEVEHRFIPPDWQEIERWTGATLAFSAPQCGRAPRNEIRARLHRATDEVMPAAPPRPSRRGEVLELVAHARASADAGRGGDATQFAERALAALSDDMIIDAALADAIAAAHFLAIEADVERFLAREPAEVDAQWLKELTTELDRIARRYERMQDVVRLPAITRWLQAGRERMTAMTAHLDDLLATAGYRRKR